MCVLCNHILYNIVCVCAFIYPDAYRNKVEDYNNKS